MYIHREITGPEEMPELGDYAGWDFKVATDGDEFQIEAFKGGGGSVRVATFEGRRRANAVLRELAEAIGRGDRVFFMPKE